MHEKDSLDRMLESSLSSYGDPGADSGLAERILARVSSKHKAYKPAPGWRNRFVLWAALPAAACLLLTLFLLKSAGPGATHQSASLPQPPSTSTENKAPGASNSSPPQKRTNPAVRHTLPRPAISVSRSGVRPKLDVFPRLQPLSAEEEALYVFATQVPEQQRQAVLAAQKNDDAPLNIAAIHIQPLEITDTGKD